MKNLIYQCGTCNKGFIQSHHLKIHKKKYCEKMDSKFTATNYDKLATETADSDQKDKEIYDAATILVSMKNTYK